MGQKASEEGLWLGVVALFLAILGFAIPILSLCSFFVSLYVLLKKGYSGGAKLLGAISLVLSLVGILILITLVGMLVAMV